MSGGASEPLREAGETAPVSPPPRGELSSEERFARRLLAAALLSAAVLCVPMFLGHPLALDEHGSFWIIDPGIPASIWERSQSYAATPPLPSWIQRIALAVCGHHEWSLRVPYAIAFLGAVAVTARIGRELLRPIAGGLAAVLLAWHPLVLDEVRIGRGYGLILLLASLLVLTTLRWMRSPPALMRLLAWSVIGALLVWTHYLTAPLVALCACGLFWTGASAGAGPPRLTISLWPALAGVIVAVLCAPLAPALHRMWLWSPALNGPPVDVPLLPLVGTFWWLGVPAGVVVSRLVTRLHRGEGQPAPSRPVEAVFLAFLVVAPIAGLYLLGQMGMSGLATPRYRVGFTVPAVLMCALVLTRRQTGLAACLGAAAVIGSIWWQAGRSPWKPASLGNPMDAAWKAMALVILDEGRPGDAIFVQCGLVESNLVPAFYDDPLFNSYVALGMTRFYLPVDYPRYALPWLWRQPPAMTARFLERLALQSGQRVWLAAALDTDLNEMSVDGFLALADRSRLRMAERREFGRAVLIRFEP